MSEGDDIAVFKATFPPIQSAILISGDGNGGSIKLAVPEMEMDIFTQLIGMRRAELIVTIARAKTLTEVDSSEEKEPQTVDKRRKQK